MQAQGGGAEADADSTGLSKEPDLGAPSPDPGLTTPAEGRRFTHGAPRHPNTCYTF